MLHVPPDIVVFQKLVFSMEVSLGSHANVRELLDFSDVIEATDLTTVSEPWQDRQLRDIDYHSCRTERIGDFFHYDAFLREKIDENTARARWAETRVILEDLECDSVHVERDVDRTRCDGTRDYHPVYGWRHLQFHDLARAVGAHNVMLADGAAADPSTVASLSIDTALTDDTKAVRRFLEDAAVLSSDEALIPLSDLKAFVAGCMLR